MPIACRCPNGHVLKVKDKYAGKTGLCPKCGAAMQVPAASEEEEFIEMIPREKEPPAPAGRSIFDDDEEPTPRERRGGRSSISTSESLLSSASVVKHCKKCPKCFELAPLWHVRCLKCNHYFQE